MLQESWSTGHGIRHQQLWHMHHAVHPALQWQLYVQHGHGEHKLVYEWVDVSMTLINGRWYLLAPHKGGMTQVDAALDTIWPLYPWWEKCQSEFAEPKTSACQ